MTEKGRKGCSMAGRSSGGDPVQRSEERGQIMLLALMLEIAAVHAL